MVVPTPRGETNPLVLAAAAPRRRRRGLPDRRRAGGRGARLWHGDDRAGRQDRRPRQRLCGGGQAPGLRPGRHRHDRRPVRGADPRRRGTPTPTGSPPISWPRPSTTPRRSRSSSPTAPALADAVEEARRAPAPDPAAARDRRRELARLSAPSSWCRALADAIPLVDRLAPEHLEIEAGERRRARRQGPQCRRDLPRQPHAGGDRRLCRRPEPRPADGALGPVLLGPRRARLHEAHLDPEMRAGSRCARSAPPRSRSPAPRGSRAMPARWR